MKKRAWILVLLILALTGIWALRQERTPPRTETEMISELVQGYTLASTVNEKLLTQLEKANRDTGRKWRQIMEYWASTNSNMTVNRGVLPDGLDSGDKLCIIVLGFQLKPDGSMQEELLGRLECAKQSAEKYPQAYILCTGGGTAAASDTTEAEAMAAWLTEKGIEKERILIENRSLSTSENAIYSYALLSGEYPQVTQVAIVSSDYHIPWASVLFETQFILAGRTMEVVSNAGYPTTTTLSSFSLRRYQANGMRDIALWKP